MDVRHHKTRQSHIAAVVVLGLAMAVGGASAATSSDPGERTVDTARERGGDAADSTVRVFTRHAGRATDGGLVFVLPDFPNGRYLASYDVLMSGAIGTSARPTTGVCFLSRPGADASFGYTSTTSVRYNIGLSGTSVINKRAAGWRLSCVAHRQRVGPDDWSIPSFSPIRVTLTKIDETVARR